MEVNLDEAVKKYLVVTKCQSEFVSWCQANEIDPRSGQATLLNQERDVLGRHGQKVVLTGRWWEAEIFKAGLIDSEKKVIR